MFERITISTLALLAATVPAFAQQAPDGAAAFNRACASCHREGQTTAPTPAVLRQLTPEGDPQLDSPTGACRRRARRCPTAERRAVRSS